MGSLEKELRMGLAALKLVLNDTQVSQLLQYLELIQKWSRVYNLTAVRDPEQILTHHLLDSLAIIVSLREKYAVVYGNAAPETHPEANTYLPKVRLLDVGSGAGLPGVVIAICCPDVLVHCVDSVVKKVAFIRQVELTLGLPNLHGLHARVESLSDQYNLICCRAFASLADFTRWSSAVLAGDGIWLALKGKLPVQEIAALPVNVEVFHVEHLTVPGMDAERCLVWMRKT